MESVAKLSDVPFPELATENFVDWQNSKLTKKTEKHLEDWRPCTALKCIENKVLGLLGIKFSILHVHQFAMHQEAGKTGPKQC